MFTFRNKTCVAITWDSLGQYWGVRLLRQRNGYKLTGYWHSGPRSNDDISSTCFLNAFSEMKVQSDDLVLLGGNLERCCGVDLKLGLSSKHDIESALTFAIRNHSPLPTDSLHTIWRNLGDGFIRCVYLKRAEWNDWLSKFSTSRTSVDAFVPLQLALEGITIDEDILFQSGSEIYLSEKTADDRVVLSPTSSTALPQAKCPDWLRISTSMDDAPDLFFSYLPAIHIARYGLCPSFEKDRKNWSPLPSHLRPRRGLLLKTAALLLSVYLLISSGIAGVRYTSNKLAHSRRRNAEQRELRATLLKAKEMLTINEQIIQLETDIETIRPLQTRQLSNILAALTEQIDSAVWAKRIVWHSSGSLELDLFTDEESVQIVPPLEKCGYFEKVNLQKRVGIDQTVNYKVTCSLMPYLEEASP